MLPSTIDESTFGILAILVVGSVLVLHFLLFREYFRQEKINLQKLKELENQVKLEIDRSRTALRKEAELQGLKEKTDEKLEVIKLQVGAMDAVSKKPDP
jgi:hypothetical protein